MNGKKESTEERREHREGGHHRGHRVHRDHHRERKTFPIRTIDFSNPTDTASHDTMVKLVGTMLELHKRLNAAQTPHEKNLIQRQIDSTDRQIDRLVYELYELTEEEIKIVEEAVGD